MERPEWWVEALGRLAESALGHIAIVRWQDGQAPILEWVNEAGRVLMDVAPGSLAGRRLEEVYPPELMPEILQHFRDARRSGTVSYEVVRELPTGRRTLSATTFALGDDRLVALAYDLTAEREAERRLEQVTALTGAGLYHRNLVDDLTTWTDELFRLFGYEPGAFTPSREAYVDRVHHADRPRLEELLSEVGGDKRSLLDDRHRIVRSDGEVRSVDLRAQLVRDGDGAIIYALGVVRDVTDEVERGRQAELFRLAAERQQTALQVHDRVVQALSTVVLALEMGELATARSAALEATVNAQTLVRELLSEVAEAHGGTVTPGALRATTMERSG